MYTEHLKNIGNLPAHTGIEYSNLGMKSSRKKMMYFINCDQCSDADTEAQITAAGFLRTRRISATSTGYRGPI